MKNYYYILFLLSIICYLTGNSLSVSAQTTFQMAYGGANDDEAHTLCITNDNHYIIAGTTMSFGSGGKDICIIKTNENGNVIWSKTYGGSQDELPRSIIQTNDNGFIIVGNTYSFGHGERDIYILKIDTDGNLQWSKVVGGDAEDRGFTVVELNNGDFIVGGTTQSFGAGMRDAYIFRIDSTGNVAWNNIIGGAGLDNCFTIRRTTDNNFIFTGTQESFGPGFRAFFIVKFNEQGDILLTKSIGTDYEEHTYNLLPTIDDGYIFLGHTPVYGAGSWDIVAIKTNSNFEAEWAKTYGKAGNDYNREIIETDDGFLIFGTTASFGNGGDLMLIKINHSGDIQWSKTYGGNNLEDLIWGGEKPLINTIDNQILFTGLTKSFGDQKQIYLVKTNYAGESGCNEDDVNVISQDFISQVQSISPEIAHHMSILSANTIVTEMIIPETVICTSGTPPIAHFRSDTIICQQDCISFIDSSYNNPNNWQWYFEGGLPNTTNLQNPIICYPISGIYDVKLIVSNEFGSDSIIFQNYITVNPSPEINLGNDTLICIGTSLTLNAGSGFDSYTWNTGSSDSTITIDTTGTYWVEVFNELGCSTIDSIIIGFYPNAIESINIGNDTTFCYGQQFIINAGSGYTFYEWQDGSTDSLYIADTAGVYYVHVLNPCGEAWDTIELSLFPITEIDLGNDTSLCKSDGFVLLDPGMGFTSYQWQDGSSNQFYYTNQSGAYWVEVTDNNGCPVTDTILLNFIDPEPELGPDTSICSGNFITFFAIDGFFNYLWQDGSGGSSFYTNTEGIYWCEVTDTLGCIGADSVLLKLLYPPDISLGNDTSICFGDSLILSYYPIIDNVIYIWQDGSSDSVKVINTEGYYWVQATNSCGSDFDSVYVSLKPLPSIYLGEDMMIGIRDEITLDAGEGFDSYLWHDGSGYQTITVSDSGNYWVRVSDGFCFNSDTINIEEVNCDLFIPIVFTPNWDNYNDYFYAVASNDIIEFNLIVFNRWGEKMWETTDINGKWNGKKNNSDSPTGTYFWITQYRCLLSNKTYMLKGSVTLLR